jgi:hypothetical protein
MDRVISPFSQISQVRVREERGGVEAVRVPG